MEENLVIKKDRKKIFLVGGICLIIIALIVGYTYSYFVVSAENSGVITGTVASGSLDLSVEQVAPSENYRDLSKYGLIPQLDGAIINAIKGTSIDGVQQQCVDGNNNVICQLYKVTVKNTGDMDSFFDGLLRLNVGSNHNLRWALVNYDESSNTPIDLASNVNPEQITTMVYQEPIKKDESKTYYIVLWISETGEEQSDKGLFDGVVTFKTSADDAAANTLYALGIAPNAETPNFSKMSHSYCDEVDNASFFCENTVGVYPMADDIGTSYVFRGDVINNYVKFGKYPFTYRYGVRSKSVYFTFDECSAAETPLLASGENVYSYCKQVAGVNASMYWRIVRINGDGTIRLIYAGTSPRANGQKMTAGQANATWSGYIYGSVQYNELKNDNAYVGYMYGNAGSSTYDATHENLFSSNVKEFLENAWYDSIFRGNEYEQYIADAIYCNDRYIEENDNGDNVGFGSNSTTYSSFRRLLANWKKVRAKLTCENPNDRFTDDANSFEGVETNGKLDAPIGLITADELVAAGAYFNELTGHDYDDDGKNDPVPPNEKFYLHTGFNFSTMTPMGYSTADSSPTAKVFWHTHNGYFRPYGVSNSDYVVLPVISIDVPVDKLGGSGTISDPFTIVG